MKLIHIASASNPLAFLLTGKPGPHRKSAIFLHRSASSIPFHFHLILDVCMVLHLCWQKQPSFQHNKKPQTL